MDTSQAMLRNLDAINRGNSVKVFDWDKAAQIIRERKPQEACAGLALDYEWTCGCIYRDGEPVRDDYTFLASNWATPMLILNDSEEIECYTTSESGFDAHTKWPDSAIAILHGESR